jgi:RNA-binding protein PNO1
VTVPQNRMTPLKSSWLELYTPVTEKMKIDMRMNLKTRKVRWPAWPFAQTRLTLPVRWS